MWQFNYGEWTEAYVFFRLLGYGRIYAANREFEKDKNVYLDILGIIRYEKNHELFFDREAKSKCVNARDNGKNFRMIAYKDLIDEGNILFNYIKKVTSYDHRFPIPEVEEYLKNMKFTQPKEPKLPTQAEIEFGKKTDVIIKIQDSTDHYISTKGFSIKSHLGSRSSLFNSSLASKFVYEITGCNEREMDEINGHQIASENGMFRYIRENPSLKLEFIGTSDKFYANLSFIELTMPQVISYALLTQIGYYDMAKSKKTKDIIAKVAESNPVSGVVRPESWYKAKMKDFLFASFSGLTATEPWNGRKVMSGGYIDVDMQGEMLYYRAISDDIFSTYLYEHTLFDTPSRGVGKDRAKVVADAHLDGREADNNEIEAATMKGGKAKPKKGDWGYVYKEDNKYYIALNFQIRFI